MTPLGPIQAGPIHLRAIRWRGRADSARSCLISLLLLVVAAPLQAGEVPFPPASTFRDLQLLTISCARDNRRDSCDSARRIADPLLDNPRLSSRCKDSLWSIRQTAVSEESNSPERRDRLDSVARDLGSFCRQFTPPANSTSGSPGSSGGGGKPINLRPAPTAP